MAFGILLSCLVVIIISNFVIPKIRIRNSFLVTIFFLVFLNIIYTIFVDGTYKPLLSLLILLTLLFAAAVMAVNLRRTRDEILIRAIFKLSILILLLGFFSLVTRIEFPGYQILNNPVFPFAEPSHYALAVSPILFFTGLFLTRFLRGVLIFLLIVLGVFFPSLILLFVVLMMISFYYLSRPLKFLIITAGLGLLIFFSLNQMEIFNHFTQRLTFTDGFTNLSTLVYIQGWEDAYIALRETSGIGLGFQRMGTLPPGEYGEKIFSIFGGFLNRNDGSFLAAKIISEFGILGILLVSGFLKSFFKSAVFISKYQKFKLVHNKGEEFSAKKIFVHTIILFFFTEMFIRGYGYFSSGVFLLFMSILILLNRGKHEKSFLK